MLRRAVASNLPVGIVLACLTAGTIEVALFIFAVHRTEPDWNTALGVNRVGIVTSAVCLLAAFAGLLQRRSTILNVLLGWAIAVGVAGILVSLMILAVSYTCFICI